MLGQLIVQLLLGPIGALTSSWHWVSWPAVAGFFGTDIIIFAPGLLLAAPIVFAVLGAFAARTDDRRTRLLESALAAVAFALVAGVAWLVAYGGPGPAPGLPGLTYVPVMILVAIVPVTALSLFAFWLPSALAAAYVALARRPRWWASGLIGAAAVLGGLWMWIVIGQLVGA